MNNNDLYINIKDIAEAKGLTSTRSIRLKLNSPESGYISREVKVNGGTSYEILFSSLEPETQKLLLESGKKSTALIPMNYQPAQFVSDSAKLTANFRTNIVVALQKLRKKYPTKKEADSVFLDLYNSGLYLPKAYKFIGSISIGTLHRWVQAFEKHESAECLQPKYKFTRQGEYNSILNDEMKYILLTFLLHPSQYNYGKAIKLTKELLKKRGYENLPCDLTFKRYAEHFALIYSEPGIGKTHMLLKWALDNDAVYIRAINGMTQPGLLKTIVTDLDLTDYHNMQTNFNHIVKSLQQEPRVIIVDEVDYLIGDKNVIEILRDIQDITNVPIILSGMEFVNRKIARFKHIKSRLYKSLKLKYYDSNEISDILEQLTNLKFTDGAIKYLTLRKVPFRQIVQTIQELESYSQTNNIIIGFLNKKNLFQAD